MPERSLSRIGGQLSVRIQRRGGTNRSVVCSSVQPSQCNRRVIWRAVTAVVGSALTFGLGGRATSGATTYWDGDGLGTVNGGAGQWDLSLPRWGAFPSASTYSPFVNND